jgi:hypothetical protein
MSGSTTSNGNNQANVVANGDRLILFSIESFIGPKGGMPSTQSLFCTGAVTVAFLLLVELTLRQFFVSIQVREKDPKWMVLFIGCPVGSGMILLYMSITCKKLLYSIVAY